MRGSRMECRRIRLTLFLVSLVGIAGCRSDNPPIPSYVGTTTEIVIPESNPPVLTRALADKIRPGMAQREILAALREAGSATELARSLVETAELQGKLNNIRYDLSISQGNRKLSLSFKAEKLLEKKQEGLD